MPGALAHLGMVAICPHAGQVSVVPGNTRVLVSGQPVVTLADQYPIAGCAFTLPGPKASPCVRVQWIAPATRVLVNGQPPILQTSAGQCLSPEQAPQGPPSIVTVQPRVVGT